MTELTMDKLVSLCKRRGFVFPSSEIYGGFQSIYDFGPLGTGLTMNLKKLWWQNVVNEREDVEGIDGQIITHPKVWEASGHVESFTDPLVDCKSCKRRFRADQLLEKKLGVEKVAGKSLAELGLMLADEQITCENCGMIDWTEPRQFNLLVETNFGVTEADRVAVYLRGETCQTIFTNFENVLQTMRQKLPFGIAQIGKSFRNEITTGNYYWRTREFEQMELEYFLHPSEADAKFDYWKAESFKFLTDTIGIKAENLRWRQHEEKERAHYARDAWDIEYKAPWGWVEFWAQHNRGDWDLKRHSAYSGHDLQYFDQLTGEKYLPFVVETSMGVGRLSLVALMDAYAEEEVGEGDKKETRVVLKFTPKVAPIKIAILPLMNKDNLTEVSRRIFDALKSKYICQHDVTQSIGKRYRRQDEIGTPYCLTVDFDTVEKDQAVTVRDRDTMHQERIKIDDLVGYFQDKFN